jgi:hypothetical protein
VTHRHNQYAAAAGAALLAAVAAATVYRGMYAAAAMFGIGVAVCLEAAVRERRRHLRAVAEHEWARQAAVGDSPQPLRPCCLLAQASRGRAHHHDRCTRNAMAVLLLSAEADHRDAP